MKMVFELNFKLLVELLYVSGLIYPLIIRRLECQSVGGGHD